MKRKTQKQIKADKQRAGRLGGLTTVERHGPEHMSRIGRIGARETWRRYHLTPYGQTQFAMVSRATGKIIKIIGSAPRMESILGE